VLTRHFNRSIYVARCHQGKQYTSGAVSSIMQRMQRRTQRNEKVLAYDLKQCKSWTCVL